MIFFVKKYIHLQQSLIVNYKAVLTEVDAVNQPCSFS